MKFRYQQKHGKYLPIIPIRLRSAEGEWITFDGYVDSGASYSIFTEEIGEILGIDVEKGDKIHITVGDGSLITVYLHNLEVKIGKAEFNATVGFSKHLGIGFNVLGRKDFFDRFRVCFDEARKTVEFL
jgi:predicted aspartyl protease